ncbi:MAG: hypothetical protein ACF8QF_10380 [Phycisphaerales bacterium]
MRPISIVISACALVGAPLAAFAEDEASAAGRAQFREQAAALADLVESDLALTFLAVADDLRAVEPRQIHYRRADRAAMTPEQYEAASEAERDGFAEMTIDWRQYYGLMSTPLAWTRPLEVLAAHGFTSADDARILDFGFGNVGQLRMLASMGADVVGVEIPGIHEVMYRLPDDTGPVERAPDAGDGPDGSIDLAFGFWPGGEGMRDAAGDDFDLIMTKNVLKLGYIHPEQEADPRTLIHLGVDDDAFVQALYDSLAPGGIVFIYNLYPQQPEDRYLPWAHGENPFDRALWEATGFEALAWNVPDSPGAQAMGRALGWDQQRPETYEQDFNAMYTILRRPAE